MPARISPLSQEYYEPQPRSNLIPAVAIGVLLAGIFLVVIARRRGK